MMKYGTIISKYQKNKPYISLDKRIDNLSTVFPESNMTEWKKESKKLVNHYGYYNIEESMKILYAENVKKIDNKYKPHDLKMILDLERSWRSTALTDCFIIEQKMKIILGEVWGKEYFNKNTKKTISEENLNEEYHKSIIDSVIKNTKKRSYSEYTENIQKVEILSPWLIIENLTFGTVVNWIAKAKDPKILGQIMKSIFNLEDSEVEAFTNKKRIKYIKKIGSILFLRNHLSHQGTLSEKINSKYIGEYVSIIMDDFEVRSNLKNRYRRDDIIAKGNSNEDSKALLESFLKRNEMNKYC